MGRDRNMCGGRAAEYRGVVKLIIKKVDQTDREVGSCVFREGCRTRDLGPQIHTARIVQGVARP